MNSPQTIVLGITGGIACGKTEAGRILSAEGFKVLDTDFLAHELMEKGRPVHKHVTAQFGKEILAEGGEIDRVKLGKRVFDDPAKLEMLNRLVHPAVIATAKAWVTDCREAGEDAAVLVPLLFETGWTEDWDAVICLTAPEKTVLARLKKRGLPEGEARKRMAAQMPPEQKAALADFTVENSGTLEGLRSRLIELAEAVRSRKKEQL